MTTFDATRALEMTLGDMNDMPHEIALRDMLRAAVAEVERLDWVRRQDQEDYDRLAAENEKLRGDVVVCSHAMNVQVREIDSLRDELRLARAAIEAARQLVVENQDMDTTARDGFAAYDAHVTPLKYAPGVEPAPDSEDDAALLAALREGDKP